MPPSILRRASLSSTQAAHCRPGPVGAARGSLQNLPPVLLSAVLCLSPLLSACLRTAAFAPAWQPVAHPLGFFAGNHGHFVARSALECFPLERRYPGHIPRPVAEPCAPQLRETLWLPVIFVSRREVNFVAVS
jgi:hypothetical protein